MLSLRLRNLALAFASLVLIAGTLFAPLPAAAQDKPQLFINVTDEDPWKVSMAAFFGTAFAQKQGHQTTLFVNVQATPLFTKAKSAVRSEQFGKSVHDMVREFQAAGGKVLICPVCMKALGISADDLIDGAEVATVQSVNAVLFNASTKTLAW